MHYFDIYFHSKPCDILHLIFWVLRQIGSSIPNRRNVSLKYGSCNSIRLFINMYCGINEKPTEQLVIAAISQPYAVG